MKVVVFGATGYTGGNIIAELLERGHEVVGIARDVSGLPQHNHLTGSQGDIHDSTFTDSITDSADAIVVALPAVSILDGTHPSPIPTLLVEAAKDGARLGVMGGAGSLLVSENGPRLADTEGFPDDFKPEASAAAQVLEELRGSSTAADWFFVSPGAGYGSYNPGERTGSYRTGGDVLLSDDKGESFISGADLAIAFVDELENPKHHSERFTVAY